MTWKFTPSGRLLSRDEALIETFERAMAIPGQPSEQRSRAVTRLDMVNVLGWLGNRGSRDSQPLRVTRPRTHLFVQAWVSNVAYAKDVWADVYLLDGAGAVLYAQTFGLQYVEPAGANGDFFVLDAWVPSSGLGPRAGEARRLQFRLYYEVEGTLFTDGFAHDHELVPPVRHNELRAPSNRRSLIMSRLLLAQAATRSRRRF